MSRTSSFLSRALWGALPLVAILFYAVVAYSQTSDTPGLNVDPVAFMQALWSKNWPYAVGVAIYFALALTKQGWFGAWLQKVMTPRWYPLSAPVLAALGTFATNLVAGQTFAAAGAEAVRGVFAAFTAILMHQVGIEAMRGGKEVIPDKKPANDNGAPPAKAA